MSILRTDRPTPFRCLCCSSWLRARRYQAAAAVSERPSDAAAGNGLVSDNNAWRVGVDRDNAARAPTCGRGRWGALMIKCCGAHAGRGATGEDYGTRSCASAQIKAKEREISAASIPSCGAKNQFEYKSWTLHASWPEAQRGFEHMMTPRAGGPLLVNGSGQDHEPEKLKS